MKNHIWKRILFSFFAGTGFFLVFLSNGCGKKEFHIPVGVKKCDSVKAMQYAEKSVSFGDRYSGSAAIKKYGNWITEILKTFPGVKVKEQVFQEDTPTGKILFRNIVAEIPGKSPDFIVAGAHYDTKKFSSFSFPGANDGASGVSALLLIAETLAANKEKLPYSVHLVFFDGEECQLDYGENDGLHGSKYYASSLDKRKNKCRGMILLDMIGDKDLCIAPPANTHKAMLSLFRKSAAFLKKEHLTGEYKGEILDDHVPFMQKGIPAIDLIDFSYGPDNVFWHTPEDSLEKISGESIAFAADIVTVMLFNAKNGLL